MEFVRKGKIINKGTTGSDNDLVSNRRQAIIWTKRDVIDWCKISVIRPQWVTLTVFGAHVYVMWEM